MLANLWNHKVRIFTVMTFIIGLVMVRMFEDALFYDPFLNYYRLDTNLPFPEYDSIKLFFDTLFRYVLNTALSLAIIYTIFKDIELTKFAGFLYLLSFIVLISAFFIVLQIYGQQFKLEIFYIRRFLIHPVLLLLFLPALYFQKIISKK